MKNPPVMIALGEVIVPLSWVINHFGTLVRALIEDGEMVDRFPTFTFSRD